MKAAMTPSAASRPKERRAGIPENMFAMNAATVVKEVNIIARPTRLSEIIAAVSEVPPRRRSSLYRCNAWRLSSIPRARIRIGSKFEN
jgi:hypothetical protein